MSNINITVTEQDPINVSIASPEVQNVDINATTLTATVADGDKGDIVVTGNGTVWTLDPNALATRVPYTGATSDVNLGEFGLLTGNIEFDTTPTNAPTGAGSMVWNDTEGTVDLVLKGGNMVLPLGQKQTIRAVNGTGGNLTRVQYRAVKIIGAQGQRAQIGLARADNDANSKDTIGIVGEDISNNQEGFIVTSGLIEEINTTGSLQGETWADGDTLYLSGTTSGIITNVKPAAPIHTVILGFVVYAHANHGKIYVKVDNGYELDELHNVNVSTAASGDYLRYNGTTWVDATISAADLPSAIDASKIGSGLVSNTEFGYLDGVTSAIQTQLNSKQATLTLTTTGTSGAATLVGATLNIPQYQAVLTNPVTGTGTSGQVSFFSGTSSVTGDNGLFWDNTNKRLGVGTTAPTNKLMVIAGNSSGLNLSYDTSGNNRTGIFAWTNASSGGGIGGGVEQTSDFVFTARSTSASSVNFGGGNISFNANTGLTAGSTYTQTARMLIWGSGNISVGNTSDAGYRFDITGDIRNTTSAYFATSSGAVGIGTTTITGGTIFNVAGVSELRGDVYLGKSATSNSVSYYFNASSTNRGEISYDATGQFFKISSTYGGSGTFTPLTLFTGNAERMRLTAAGRLLIGTTTESTYLLDVAGTARVTTLTWAQSGGYMYGGGLTHIFAFANSGLNLCYSGGTFGWGINNAADTTRLLTVNDIGCIGLGVSTFEASVTRAMYVATGVNPAASTTDGFVMYSADITAGNAAPHFRTEGGAVVKLYQQTTGVGAAAFVANSGTAVNDASTFGGYTLKQIVQALQNAGFLA